MIKRPIVLTALAVLIFIAPAYAQVDSGAVSREKPKQITKGGRDNTPQGTAEQSSGNAPAQGLQVSPTGIKTLSQPPATGLARPNASPDLQGNDQFKKTESSASPNSVEKQTKDMQRMKQGAADRNAAKEVNKSASGLGLGAKKPDDALSKSGAEQHEKIKSAQEEAQQKKTMKLSSCTMKCKKSNPATDAAQKSASNASKMGQGIGNAANSANEYAKENELKKGNSPSENKMMEEAKAKAKAEKEAKEKAEAAAKKAQADQIIQACIKECMEK